MASDRLMSESEIDEMRNMVLFGPTKVLQKSTSLLNQLLEHIVQQPANVQVRKNAPAHHLKGRKKPGNVKRRGM